MDSRHDGRKIEWRVRAHTCRPGTRVGHGCRLIGSAFCCHRGLEEGLDNTQGVADIDFAFGQPGDIPIAGDWDGDGVDTVGVYRPSTKMVYLINDFSNNEADISFNYSGTASGDRIVVGDWDGDGDDTVGVFRPSTITWYLRDTFTQSSANIVFTFGESYMNPVAGDWGG